MKKLFTLFIIVICTMSLSAQVPQKMSYQAVIRDVENTLVKEQSVGMQISIVQGSADGTIVYSETQNPISNINGLVSIEIGTGNTIDDFTAIDWSNGPYFVKTETDLEGGSNYTVSGTSQLLSVPFAFMAATVANDQVDDADADPSNEIELPETDNEGANLAWNDGVWSADASGVAVCISKIGNALTTYAEIGDLQFRYNPGGSGSGFIEVKSVGDSQYYMIYGTTQSSSYTVDNSSETKHYRSAIFAESDWQALMTLWNGSSWDGRVTFGKYHSFEAIAYLLSNDFNVVPSEPCVYVLHATVDDFSNVLIRVEYTK